MRLLEEGVRHVLKGRDVTISVIQHPDFTHRLHLNYHGKTFVQEYRDVELSISNEDDLRKEFSKLRDKVVDFVLGVEDKRTDEMFAKIAVGEVAPDRPTLPPPPLTESHRNPIVPKQRRYLEL